MRLHYRETSNTFVGDYRTRTHIRACEEWPRGIIPADYYEPVKSDVPALMFSGQFDPATPPEFGQAAANFLPNSRQLIIQNVAHGYGGKCLRNIASEFISKGSTREIDNGCIRELRPPKFDIEAPK